MLNSPVLLLSGTPVPEQGSGGQSLQVYAYMSQSANWDCSRHMRPSSESRLCSRGPLTCWTWKICQLFRSEVSTHGPLP